ncbi:hypothetical protein ACFL2R_03460 [Patescibacteria group bacterium]
MAEKISVPCEVKDLVVLMMFNDDRCEIEVESREFGDLPEKTIDFHSFYYKKKIAGDIEYGGKKYNVVTLAAVEKSKMYYMGEKVSYEQYERESSDEKYYKENAKEACKQNPNTFILRTPNGTYRTITPYGEYEVISPDALKK